MGIPISASAIAGWFDPETPAMLGQSCTTCGSVFFPPTLEFCQNPACEGEAFDTVPLSDHGTVWSWTTNHYKPPAPYIAADPFEPYTVLAVELAREGMVVLGQLSPGSTPVDVGDHVELRSETLYEDERGTHLVWRWSAAVDSLRGVTR